MKLRILATTLLIPLWVTVPAQAQNAPTSRSNAQMVQTPPTAQQVLAACVENRAETLPIPFTDVSPDHWAFKSVMTMHYCGAFRQATPPALIQRLIQEQNRQMPQAERQQQPNLP